MTPDLVYDLETEDWVKFVIGATYDGRDLRFYSWRQQDALMDRVLSTDGVVVAHNGGRFDHLWLLDRAQREAIGRSNGSGLVEIRIGRTRLLDSARLYPMTLAELSAGKKRSLADLCTCREQKSCGGYCAIKRNASPKVMQRIKDYLAADVRELWNALRHMATVADDAGLDLGVTVGSTAWKSARAFLGLDRARFDRPDWEFLRRGYYGGRVEPWRRTSPRGYAADVHSMYPWALSAGDFPVGFQGITSGSSARTALRRGKPGVYMATVDVPESFAPPLPYRINEGIAFPWGRGILGVWCLPEIEHAVECGTKIRAVHFAATFDKTERIFAPWVQRMFDLRMKYGKSTREGIWIKFVLNSLTGKFGSRSTIRRLQLFPDMDSIKLCTCGRGLECGCGGSHPLDLTGRVFEQVITPSTVEGCAHVQFAAYLTAMARIKLHGAIDDSAVYGDTDSIFRERALPKALLGRDLGTWDDLGPYRNMTILAPKVYRVTLGRKTVIASKGIPHTAWKHIIAGKPIEWKAIAGVRRAGSGPFFSQVTRTRTITPNLGRRLPDGPNLTRPPNIKDLI